VEIHRPVLGKRQPALGRQTGLAVDLREADRDLLDLRSGPHRSLHASDGTMYDSLGLKPSHSRVSISGTEHQNVQSLEAIQGLGNAPRGLRDVVH
jgi:hypothetical protein